MANEVGPAGGDAPLVTSVAVEPIVAAPAVVETPIVEAAPAVVEPVIETPAADPVAENAPVEPVVEAAPAEGEPKAAETEKTAEEPAKPTYTEFKMPEGIKAAPEQIEAFTKLLGDVDVRTQEGAQALLDLHADSLKKFAEATAQHQQDVFTETRAKWAKDFEKQAGNRRDTILNDAKWAIGDLFKNADERKAFNQLMDFTGVGDHPAMINALAKVAKRLRERTAPPQGVPMRGAPADPATRRYGPATKR